MQVHQTSQFVLGIMAGSSGLFLFLICLYMCLKSKTLLPWARAPFLWTTYAVILGAGNLSRAFDEPYQESHRTIFPGWLSLLVVTIGITAIIVLNRAEKKAKADVGITPLGEHKA